MESFSLEREIARLILLRRIELTTSFKKKIKKFFGRYFLINFFFKYLINPEEIGEKYFQEMQKMYKLFSSLIIINCVQKNIPFSKGILSKGLRF